MTFWAQPQKFSATRFSHFSGRWIVGVPLPGQPGVVGHRLALTEAATLAVTARTEQVASISCHVACQAIYPSLPFVVPAAFVFAA